MEISHNVIPWETTLASTGVFLWHLAGIQEEKAEENIRRESQKEEPEEHPCS
jgi:hypothetical protein